MSKHRQDIQPKRSPGAHRVRSETENPNTENPNTENPGIVVPSATVPDADVEPKGEPTATRPDDGSYVDGNLDERGQVRSGRPQIPAQERTERKPSLDQSRGLDTSPRTQGVGRTGSTADEGR